jgi:hypothetical protein
MLCWCSLQLFCVFDARVTLVVRCLHHYFIPRHASCGNQTIRYIMLIARSLKRRNPRPGLQTSNSMRRPGGGRPTEASRQGFQTQQYRWTFLVILRYWSTLKSSSSDGRPLLFPAIHMSHTGVMERTPWHGQLVWTSRDLCKTPHFH